MFFHTSDDEKIKRNNVMPGLHLMGALLVVVLNALFSAVYSPLGQEISAGESPGLAWIRAHMAACMGFTSVYLIVVCMIQIRQPRRASSVDTRLLPILTCIEIVGVAAMVLLIYWQQADLVRLVTTVLMISILGQGAIAFRPVIPDFDHQMQMLRQPMNHTGLFLIMLFVLGAAIPFLDPSWQRLADQIVLDSNFESHLRYVFPSILSGTTSLWLGIGMLAIIIVISHLLHEKSLLQNFKWLILFLIFFSLIAAFGSFLFLTLFYAISWQIQNLNLELTVWHFVVFFSVTGGILFSSVFYRILTLIPLAQQNSLVGIVALTLGAAIIFPITWLLTSQRDKKKCGMLLLICTLGACIFLGYAVLFGNLFNPWFTAFSYLKGAIIKIMTVVAAGTAVLLTEQFLPIKANVSSNFRRLGFTLAITAVLGFLPFYVLNNYPELKVVVLQFNELTRVDATFAREFANVLGFGQRLRLGQRPPPNSSPHPWPQPWKLTKSHSSLLPKDFNLIIIVVDALRGDAFHSAGYRRNLTPFLDRWGREEAISFRRAYSQGGGSFAAIPFLIAGRSRFDLYGPGLYRQNLYFKIAQAEGIQHYMLMKGFGPRAIYPPELPVIELAIPRAVSDRRSATADEVFDSARKAIEALSGGERFLCFLQLMDVHNDLWKKADGINFGDAPRDLYDNNLSYIDRAFSRFITWLKQERIYEKTVILFTSDHGEQFWEHGASLHGHTVYEEEIRVPLILAAHGLRKRVEHVPVIAADMAPTIADLAGYSIDPPYEDPHMGISLLPLIQGREHRRYLKRDMAGRASFKRRYFLYRNWEWKLVYFAELDLLQLFNVIKDPLEKKNYLAEEPELAAEMEIELLEYLKSVGGKTYRPTFSKR